MHDDHGAVDTVPGHPQVFVHPSSATVGRLGDHRHPRGARRGGRAQPGQEHHRGAGRRRRRLVAHLGDLGHLLDASDGGGHRPVDVLLVPVGGFFTIDHKQAAKVVEPLDPRIVIPMHYKTAKVDFPISGVGAVPGHPEDRGAQGELDHRDHPGDLAARTRDLRSSGSPLGARVSSPDPDRRTLAIAPARKHTQAEEARPKPAKRGRILRMKPGPLRTSRHPRHRPLVVFFGLGSVLSRIWTNYLWYAEVGQTEVFWTPFLARLCVGLFFAVVFFAIFYGSLWLARKISPRLLAGQDTGDEDVLELKPRRRWPGRLLLLVVHRRGHHRRRQPTAAAGTEVLLFLNRGVFGYADPLFGKDASFFVFTLPVWKMLVNFVGIALLFTFIATVLTYVADRALVLNAAQPGAAWRRTSRPISRCSSPWPWWPRPGDYMIQSWSLDYSTRGAVFGASYTDVHASLPVLHFLAIVSLVAAAIFLANIRYRGWRLPAIAIAVMFLTWAFAGKAYPAIVQQYKVSPNEITAETPVYRQQHRGHPLRLRPGQDHQRLPSRRAPTSPPPTSRPTRPRSTTSACGSPGRLSSPTRRSRRSASTTPSPTSTSTATPSTASTARCSSAPGSSTRPSCRRSPRPG